MADYPSNINSSPNTSTSALKDFQLTESVVDKQSEDYGRKLSAEIWGKINGVSSYFWLRNNRFRKNRLIANGKFDMSVFMDRLDMNGKFNYVNINWKAIQIVGTIISRMVGRWKKRNEKIDVSAVDPVSIQSKNESANMAEYFFDNKDNLMQLQEQSGVPMIPQDQFIAEDKDDLFTWKQEFNKIPEEISYDLAVNNVLQKNGWYDVIKDKVLHDSAEVGLVCAYTWMDDEGQIHVDWIKPENSFSSYSEFPDFRDTSWRGHIVSMKISEIRAKYGKEFGGKLTEEQLWQIAGNSKDWQYYDKIRFMQEWNVTLMRPYDEWNIDVMCWELRSLDSDGYTVTKTKKNNSTIIRKGKPEKLDDNQEYVEEKKWNIYKGVYIPCIDTILEWGIKKNMIRPQDPKELGDAEFSYSFYMYENYDMRNVAIPEKVEEPIEQMILARLKIQQLVAKMAPAGYAIDVDALQELDLGLANMSKPMDIQKIHEQTGRLYYRGRDAEGNKIPPPITELANAGFLPQMQALISLYQFHYQVLKDELGDDPNLSQAAAMPRVTAGNVDTSLALSNDTTDHYYDAYKHLMEDIGRKVGCLLNKSVSYGSKVYREIVKEDEVKGRVFQTRIQMLPTENDLAIFDAQLQNALAANKDLILYLDPMRLMRIAKENVQFAELLFRNAQKRYLKSQQQINAQNSENNAKSQQQSLQLKAQSDNELKDKELNGKERITLLTGAFDLLKTGQQLPANVQKVVEGILVNISMPLMAENAQMVQMAQQQQMQQQQEQEGQQGEEQEMQEPQLQTA